MRSSLLALRSLAGALGGLTSVFWLTATPPAKPVSAASATMYARAEAFGLARLLNSWRHNLPGSFMGVDETENFRGLDHRAKQSVIQRRRSWPKVSRLTCPSVLHPNVF